jgi:cell wall-associated NlpC family hydrolase
MALAITIFAAMAVGAAAIEMKTGIGIVQTNTLRLRAKPNTEAEILANASYGDHVVIIRKVDNWYLVDYNLQVGYMSADYIEFKDRENVELGNGVVEDAAVNLRAKPASDSDLVAQIKRGEEASIIGFNCGWYKVVYNGNTGYIRSDLLALAEAPVYNSKDSVGSAPVVLTVGEKIANYSKDFMGVPYVWGGTTPKGFDCSGYTRYVFGQMGYSLKRTAAEQLSNGVSVSKAELKIGDLVFFQNTYSTSAAASHVGIYIGEGRMIHADSQGVRVTELSYTYYDKRYIGARRVLISDAPLDLAETVTEENWWETPVNQTGAFLLL